MSSELTNVNQNSNGKPILEIRGLVKSFGSNAVLKGINLDVSVGEKIAIIGASGSGKSTLLRCINGLDEFQGGTIFVDGMAMAQRSPDIRKIRKECGFVFQQFNLFPHMTALRNVSLAVERVRGLKKDAADSAASDQLKRVGLTDKMNAYPDNLSGGQQQRVAIARALALKPKVMLFDEPTSALDPELVNGVLEVIKQVVSEGMTTLLVTHEMGFAKHLADKIAFFHEGVIVETGSPDQIFNNARNNRTRQFLEKVL